MVIAAVDPSKKDLKLLVKYLRLVFAGCEVVMFTDPEDAARYIQDTPIDVLFTEIVMRGMTGFGLQSAAQAVQPAVLTVFVADNDSFAGDAIKSRATGYIVKPATMSTVRESLNETKFSIVSAIRQKT